MAGKNRANRQNRRMMEFKNTRSIESAPTNQTQALLGGDSQQLAALYTGLALRFFELQKQVEGMMPSAKAADYRSLALQRLLEEKLGWTKEEIAEVTNTIFVEDFDQDSKEDDLKRGLDVVLDKTAEEGMFAISRLRLFKDGKELLEEEIPRMKLEIGKNEVFVDVDKALLGMKVGEKKRFPLTLMNKTDEAELELVGLRQKRIVEAKEPLNEPNVAERNPEQSS